MIQQAWTATSSSRQVLVPQVPGALTLLEKHSGATLLAKNNSNSKAMMTYSRSLNNSSP
jgi:hypothetical protein